MIWAQGLCGVYGVCRHWFRPIDGIRKGTPGFSVENDMLRVNGLVPGDGLPFFVLIFAVADVT